MLAPALKDRTAVEVALVTGVAAAVLVPLLPMQTGLIVAMLAGMVYGAWRDRPASRGGDVDERAVAQFWLLIVVLALGTWLMRSLPIMLHGHVPHPPWLERLLKHVPVAALTALVVPGALYLKHDGRLLVRARAHDRRGGRDARGPAHEEHARDARRRHGRTVAAQWALSALA